MTVGELVYGLSHLEISKDAQVIFVTPGVPQALEPFKFEIETIGHCESGDIIAQLKVVLI